MNDFESVELLGKYLQHLDKNDDEYAQYLKYKSTLYPEVNHHPPTKSGDGLISLCNMIKDGAKRESVIYDLDTWWFGDQYRAEDPEPILSACEREDGTTGKDYHATFFFWYHFVITLLFIVTCLIVFKAKPSIVT